MYLQLKDLLTAAEVARLRDIAQRMKFVDGRATNPNAYAKDNLQADYQDPRYAESSSLLMEALARSQEFQNFALPRTVAPPLLARYEPGMKYGAHADQAMMEIGGEPLRSDLSCTIFLGDPDAYDGGELVIHNGLQALPVKLPPGHAIVYPSTTLHEVAPVRRGVRLVAITFIQSFVAEESRRDVLFELGEISALEGANMDWLSRTRLEVARQNLMRMWAET